VANTYKRLGAVVVVANTDTGLYTVPASTSAIVSQLTVCNLGATARTFRLANVDGAIGVVANEDYIAYDVPLAANDGVTYCIGLTMQAANTILVRANHAEVVFNCSGVEIT